MKSDRVIQRTVQMGITMRIIHVTLYKSLLLLGRERKFSKDKKKGRNCIVSEGKLSHVIITISFMVSPWQREHIVWGSGGGTRRQNIILHTQLVLHLYTTLRAIPCFFIYSLSHSRPPLTHKQPVTIVAMVTDIIMQHSHRGLVCNVACGWLGLVTEPQDSECNNSSGNTKTIH
jgi:hypothetical protein